MMLCVPTNDDQGLAAQLSLHFGSAPYFTLVDIETGETRVSSNLHRDHEPGSCQSADVLRGLSAAAVLCRGLGRRAYRRLRKMGLPVFVTEAEGLAEALDKYRAGRLHRITSERACHGGLHHGHSA